MANINHIKRNCVYGFWLAMATSELITRKAPLPPPPNGKTDIPGNPFLSYFARQVFEMMQCNVVE